MKIKNLMVIQITDVSKVKVCIIIGSSLEVELDDISMYSMGHLLYQILMKKYQLKKEQVKVYYPESQTRYCPMNSYIQIHDKLYQIIDKQFFIDLIPFKSIDDIDTGSDGNTELLFFLINHGANDHFGSRYPFSYDSIITFIQNIAFKHLSLFIDCCSAGSIITMMNAANKVIESCSEF